MRENLCTIGLVFCVNYSMCFNSKRQIRGNTILIDLDPKNTRFSGLFYFESVTVKIVTYHYLVFIKESFSLFDQVMSYCIYYIYWLVDYWLTRPNKCGKCIKTRIIYEKMTIFSYKLRVKITIGWYINLLFFIKRKLFRCSYPYPLIRNDH